MHTGAETVPQRACSILALTRTTLLQPALGPMPDDLKIGVKQALPEKARYNMFVKTARELQEGKQSRDQALVTMQSLFGNAPDLIEKFEVWSAPASGAPSARPAKNSDSKLAVGKTGSGGVKVATGAAGATSTGSFAGGIGGQSTGAFAGGFGGGSAGGFGGSGGGAGFGFGGSASFGSGAAFDFSSKAAPVLGGARPV